MKQSTGLPTKFVEAFGVNAAPGLIRAIPAASQIGITPGAASLNDGFPPLTTTPLASGGVPPAIQDFNGLFNQLSAWDLWTAAAGITPYDPMFQSAISGYPLYAVVSSSTTNVPGRVWISVVDGNTTNPDTGGVGWIYLCLPSDVLALMQRPVAPYTGTVNGGGFYSMDLGSQQTFNLPNPSTLPSGWFVDLLVTGVPSGYQTAYAQIAAGAGSTALTYRAAAHTPFYLIGSGEVLRFLWTGTIFLVITLGQPGSFGIYASNPGGAASSAGSGSNIYMPISAVSQSVPGAAAAFNRSATVASLAVPVSGIYQIIAATSIVGQSSTVQQGTLNIADSTAINNNYYNVGAYANQSFPANLSVSILAYLKQGTPLSAVINNPSGQNYVPSAGIFSVFLQQR